MGAVSTIRGCIIESSWLFGSLQVTLLHNMEVVQVLIALLMPLIRVDGRSGGWL